MDDSARQPVERRGQMLMRVFELIAMTRADVGHVKSDTDAIKTHLALLNGRVGALETWRATSEAAQQATQSERRRWLGGIGIVAKQVAPYVVGAAGMVGAWVAARGGP